MDARQPTILIVDDTPENLSVLGELLQPFFRVRAANSGRRALQIALGSPTPDLILLDIMMPGLDGWEVCREMRWWNFALGLWLLVSLLPAWRRMRQAR